jgi:hypothetical protein
MTKPEKGEVGSFSRWSLAAPASEHPSAVHGGSARPPNQQSIQSLPVRDNQTDPEWGSDKKLLQSISQLDLSGQAPFPDERNAGRKQSQVSDLESMSRDSAETKETRATSPPLSSLSEDKPKVTSATDRGRQKRNTVTLAPGMQPPLPAISEHFTTIVQVNGHDAVALIDSGATGNMMSPLFASLADVTPSTEMSEVSMTVADGSKHPCAGTAMGLPLRMGHPGRTMKVTEDFFVTSMALPSGFDLILGLPWLQKWRPLFDWQSPMTATISTCQGTISLINSAPREETTLESEGRSGRKKLLASILQLRQAQRLGHELLVVHVRPATPQVAPNAPKAPTPPSPAIQAVLDEMADVFAPLPKELPPSREVDFEIRLEPDSKTANQRAYPVPLRLRDECRSQISDLLERNFISKSSSPWSAPILFVAKKAVGSGSAAVSGAPPKRSWRMVCDFRALNHCTSKHAGPLPVVHELLNELGGATHFSTLDLQQGYNQIRIKPEDRHKTAFSTPFGHYEWNVLAFGLCNAPAVFQQLLNSVYETEMGHFVVVYLDDILVYSKSEQEHVHHLRTTLMRLREHNLFAKLSKCQFCQPEVEFLGHVISHKGMEMDQHKVSAVREWPVLKSVKDVQQFLGLTGYYRKFIKDYAELALPLYKLLNKGVPFEWEAGQQIAFESLKAAVTDNPVLMLPDRTAPYEMHTDASDFAIGAVLYQKCPMDGTLRPIAFESHKLTPAQSRYATHEKELLAVVHALKVWKMYLVGGPVLVKTDHAALKWFNTQPKLTQRQARWSIAMQENDVQFVYLPGKSNIVADALSRRPDLQVNNFAIRLRKRTQRGMYMEPDEEVFQDKDSTAQDPPADNALSPRQKEHDTEESIGSPPPKTLFDAVRSSYQTQSFNPCTSLQGQFSLTDGLWYKQHADGRSRVVIPEDAKLQESILHELHDSRATAHMGQRRTTEQVSRYFWWPGMTSYIKAYIKHCHACQVMKAGHRKPSGLLRPLQIPSRPWSSVSMDLITALPPSGSGNDCIFVVVDRMTKMCHFEACSTTITAVQLAELFTRVCWRHHGMPLEIVSDRDPRFTARFWQSFWKCIGTNLAMSSAYHPQTDGQTERTNRTLEQMLRFYVNRQLSNWDELLLCCEFAYNNSEQASTGHTPFFLNYGMHPLTPVARQLPEKMLVLETTERLKRLASAQDHAKESIAEAQRRQKAHADRSRSDVGYEVGQSVLLKLKGRPQQKGPAQKLRPERAGPFKIVEVMTPNIAMRLDMSTVSWKGHDIFHVSQLTPYHDGVDIFPSRTPESVQPCEVAHLDGWEAENREFAVNELKASRINPVSRKMEWFVSFRGYAADSDLWIGESQMNDLLKTEAAERSVELREEGERLAKLEATTSANCRAVRTQRQRTTRRQQQPPPGTT